MFALRVTYLSGRVYASNFYEGDDKQTPEWPPHPSRLFSALVAAWGEGGAEPELRPALAWLERQGEPRVLYGEASTRTLVRVYVPVNDSRGEEAVPDSRPRKARTFPSVSLSTPDVYFVWSDSIPEELERPLDEILKRTCALGHSSSLVSVTPADTIPAGLQELVPDTTGTIRLRVAYPGRLNELNERYQRFQENPSKVNRPSGGRSARYARPAKAQTEPTGGIFEEMFILAPVGRPSLPLGGTLQLTLAARNAAMVNAPQPCPEIINGHAAGSTEDTPTRSERPHLAFVPLPFAASPRERNAIHATGAILGVAALLPKDLEPAEREVCLATLYNIKNLHMASGVWEVAPVNTEERRFNLHPKAWTGGSYGATEWATVTPFVFDQFPRDPYGEDAQQVVRRALSRSGYPEPASVAVMKTSPHIGVPPAYAFPAAPSRPGKPRRFHHHVLVVFHEPVSGPLVAGAGRFYGYGFFRPMGRHS